MGQNMLICTVACKPNWDKRQTEVVFLSLTTHSGKRIEDAELAIQREKAHRVQSLLSTRYAEPPLAAVITFGCQQNVADSERIKGMLAQMGYAFTEEPRQAKLILFNTCAVREHAEDRVFGNVGALKSYKRDNPDVVIALCGCMMQQEHIARRIKESFPFVDLVFGTHVIHRLPELLLKTLTGKKRVFETPDMDGVIAEGVPVRRDDGNKAWLPIMYGCNNFCSYCIVPYVRGRERSRQMQEVVAEAWELVKQGYKEITLLGQNVNSYGKDLEPAVSFSQLLRELNRLDGDFRIRFMTSHPRDCTFELLDTMAECDKVAKHLHLPFQSGNDRVLKAMNRHYDRARYVELIRYAKEKMGDALSITSDVIVGFPGETYQEFQDTLSLVETIRPTALFTFIFSARVGTPAAEMEDPVSREEKGKWLRELLAVQEKISASEMQRMNGRILKTFVTGKGKLADNYVAARSDGNLIIEFEGAADLIGTFQTVKVTEALTYVLKGERVQPQEKKGN